MNKAIKLFANIQISNNDFLTKETASSLKTKDAKIGLILKREVFVSGKNSELFRYEKV